MNRHAYDAVLQAWHEDAGYRARVAANPRAALAEKGLDLTEGEVRVAVNAPGVVHVVFPPAPDGALPDGAMEGVVGGVSGRRDYGVYAPDGRFLGYTTNTGF